MFQSLIVICVLVSGGGNGRRRCGQLQEISSGELIKFGREQDPVLLPVECSGAVVPLSDWDCIRPVPKGHAFY